jgi:hypothetical protein
MECDKSRAFQAPATPPTHPPTHPLQLPNGQNKLFKPRQQLQTAILLQSTSCTSMAKNELFSPIQLLQTGILLL